MTNQPSNPRLRLRPAGIWEAAAEVLGPKTFNYTIAKYLDIEPANFSRLMAGARQPSEKFVVSALVRLAAPGQTYGEAFDRLFEIIDIAESVAA